MDKTIYVSNHYDYMDSLLIIYALKNMNFVVKTFPIIDKCIIGDYINTGPLLYQTNIFKQFSKLKCLKIVMLEVDSGNSYEDLKYQMIKKKIDKIWIFPSGNIVKKQFKIGAFKLAHELNYQICPVKLHNFDKHMETNDLSNLSIEFLKPFHITNKNDIHKSMIKSFNILNNNTLNISNKFA
jgi:1-acyl-sn-glycerol-3-phosphate acyltransferase